MHGTYNVQNNFLYSENPYYATIRESSPYTLQNFTILVLSFVDDSSRSNKLQSFMRRKSSKRRFKFSSMKKVFAVTFSFLLIDNSYRKYDWLVIDVDNRVQSCLCKKFANLAFNENLSFLKNDPDATIKKKGTSKTKQRNILASEVCFIWKQQMSQLRKRKTK
jgi:hypothetical protein